MSSLSEVEIVYCAAVLLVAYGLRGSTGFGGAIGMPLLALVIPIKTLLPVWTLLGAASSIAVLGHARRHVAVRDFVAFIPWCMLGVAVGVYFFAALDARMLTRGLGIVILSYAGYSLWNGSRSRSGRQLAHRAVAPVAGILSGAVGTAFGTMGSLFFVMYLDGRALAKEAFRATMSAMLLTLSLLRGIGYFVVGEFTRDAWLTFAAAFPLMLAGIYLGDRIHVRVSEPAFRRLVCVTLAASGIPLLFR